MERNYYSAFSLRISSDIPLPELCFAPQYDADVDIRLADSIADFPEHALQFEIGQVGNFCIAEGKQIWVCPKPGACADLIRLFILGSSMGAILHQRGKLVLHGNAIAIGESCIAFVGASGNGKSTLAGAFSRLGYPVLTDDVCAVSFENGLPFVSPGYPQIKLWRDSAEELHHSPSLLQPIYNREDKYMVPLHDGFVQHSLPLKRMYVLEPWDFGEVDIIPLTGIDKFRAIFDNTYRQHFVNQAQGHFNYFRACQDLANQIPVYRLRRPRLGFELNKLIDLVMEAL